MTPKIITLTLALTLLTTLTLTALITAIKHIIKHTPHNEWAGRHNYYTPHTTLNQPQTRRTRL